MTVGPFQIEHGWVQREIPYSHNYCFATLGLIKCPRYSSSFYISLHQLVSGVEHRTSKLRTMIALTPILRGIIYPYVCTARPRRDQNKVSLTRHLVHVTTLVIHPRKKNSHDSVKKKKIFKSSCFANSFTTQVSCGYYSNSQIHNLGR